MGFKVVSDIKECEKLWKKFSPDSSLWELWDVVRCFYDEKLYEPYFVVSVEGNKETGLLPLWFDKATEEYCFFGGEYPENRRFWLDHSKFEEFILQAKDNIYLPEINRGEFEKIAEHNKELGIKFKQEGHRYFINLGKIGYDIENYLKTFNKKHRKNLKYDLKQLENLKYGLLFETTEHFDEFVRLSVKRFGQESDLYDQNFAGQMKKLAHFLESKGMLHTISVEISGRIEGVELAALYNGVYYVLNGASNRDIKNLGKLLIMAHIKNAIKIKAKEVDFLSAQGGWKQLWNCEAEEYYDFIR